LVDTARLPTASWASGADNQTRTAADPRPRINIRGDPAHLFEPSWVSLCGIVFRRSKSRTCWRLG